MQKKKLRYHFDNVYDPPIELSKAYLYQVGEFIVDADYVEEHPQECMEINYIVSGECDFYVDSNLLHAKQGDICVLTKNITHKIVNKGNDPLRLAYIGFSLKDWEEDIGLYNFYMRAPLILCNDMKFLKIQFEQLLYEMHLNHKHIWTFMDACITQILIYVYRLFSENGIVENYQLDESDRQKGIIGYGVFRALRYIDHNICAIDNITQIAKELNYNPAYLSRIFKNKTGITLQRYVEMKKIEMGKLMLKSNIGVNDIAETLGYSSTTSFCRMFSRCTGCSPVQYRKKMK